MRCDFQRKIICIFDIKGKDMIDRFIRGLICRNRCEQKISVLFLLNEMYINNLDPLLRELEKNDIFSVTVCACESVQTEYRKGYTSREITRYFKNNGVECIYENNYKENNYMDLNAFEQDYIFVSTPYDIYRPEVYSSERLMLVAKLCDIEYGTNILSNVYEMLDMRNNAFYRSCYAHFIGNDSGYYISKDERKTDIEQKFVPVGCVKVDKYNNEYISGKWEKIFENHDHVRIVWKPRWTLQNVDRLFEGLNFFEKGLVEHSQVLLLEHPFFRSNLEKVGLLEEYLNFINYSNVVKPLESDDFLDYVMESDILVCDPTSLAAEYSVTGNPILVMNCEFAELNPLGQNINNLHVIRNYSDINSYLCKTKKHNGHNKYHAKGLIRSGSENITNWLQNDYLKMPSYKYFKLLAEGLYQDLSAVNKMLYVGYYDTQVMERKTCLTSQRVDEGVKMWSDEIIRLKRV